MKSVGISGMHSIIKAIIVLAALWLPILFTSALYAAVKLNSFKTRDVIRIITYAILLIGTYWLLSSVLRIAFIVFFLPLLTIFALWLVVKKIVTRRR